MEARPARAVNQSPAIRKATAMSDPVKLTCAACAVVNRLPHEKLGAGPKCGTCGAKLLPGKPLEFDPKSLQAAIRNDDLPLVVDFEIRT